MAATVAAVIAEINAKLPAEWAANSVVGAEKLGEHATPPQVIWVPTKDDFGPGMQGAKEPRVLMYRQAGLEVHIWGAGEDQPAALASTEQMIQDVLNGIHAVLNGLGVGYAVNGGRWENAGGQMQAGSLYILSVVFNLPITTVPRGLATPTVGEQTMEWQGAFGVTAGSPSL